MWENCVQSVHMWENCVQLVHMFTRASSHTIIKNLFLLSWFLPHCSAFCAMLFQFRVDVYVILWIDCFMYLSGSGLFCVPFRFWINCCFCETRIGCIVYAWLLTVYCFCQVLERLLCFGQATGELFYVWQVMDCLFPKVPNLLSHRGVFYVVVITENCPEDIHRIMNELGFDMHVVKERKVRGEHLLVLKFTRK